MTTLHSGPKALTEYILSQSKAKANKRYIILLIQGILAGMYIAIGAIGYFKMVTITTDPGLGAFLGALVFPLGIIAILLMQAELFTSDSMVMIAVFHKRTRFMKTIKILGLIIVANLIGAIFIVLLSVGSGIYSEAMMEVVIGKSLHKVEMGPLDLLYSSILCNIIVCTSVCLAYSCKDELAKIIVVWLGITVFVLSGTEHVVANMYYLFLAYFGGGNIDLLGIFYNLSIVMVGNFIGGGIIVSGINYMLAYRDIDRHKIH